MYSDWGESERAEPRRADLSAQTYAVSYEVLSVVLFTIHADPAHPVSFRVVQKRCPTDLKHVNKVHNTDRQGPLRYRLAERKGTHCETTSVLCLNVDLDCVPFYLFAIFRQRFVYKGRRGYKSFGNKLAARTGERERAMFRQMVSFEKELP